MFVKTLQLDMATPLRSVWRSQSSSFS